MVTKRDAAPVTARLKRRLDFATVPTSLLGIMAQTWRKAHTTDNSFDQPIIRL
jgi:hypothetical protein